MVWENEGEWVKLCWMVALACWLDWAVMGGCAPEEEHRSGCGDVGGQIGGGEFIGVCDW